jgi:cytochrome P450
METALTKTASCPFHFGKKQPSIAERVGDVSRPCAGVKPNRNVGHLPGRSGYIEGFKTIWHWRNHGKDFLASEAKRFGPVFRLPFGPHNLIAVADPATVSTIARNEDRVWSTALAWRTLFEGIDPRSPTVDMPVSFDFETHREVRQILQPAFSPAAVQGYVDLAAPIFERVIDGWLEAGRTTFKPDVRRLLATASSSIFIGIDDPEEAAMLDRALSAMWWGGVAPIKNRWLSGAWRRALKGYMTLSESLAARMAERRQSAGRDLFSRLCAESQAGSWLGDDGLVRLFIGVMAGAFDTTSAGLASMAYLLAKHPDWQERLRAEALATGDTRASYETTRHLNQTEWAWKETLRLLPVTSYLPRLALRETTLQGHRIPEGSYVAALMPPAMMDASVWTSPEQFDPLRFSDERAEDKKCKGAFLPFGSGAHACIGLHLATVEAKAFWHAMLTRCRFRLATDYDGHHGYAPLGVVSGDVKLVVEPL